MELRLDSPVQYVPRVGPARAKLLEKLGIRTVKDLLYHIPFRYNDFSLVSPIATLQPGETVTVTGSVETIKSFVTKTGKKVQEARVTDESGTLTVIWFNQPYLVRVIHEGDRLTLSGQITWFGNKIVMSSPVWETSGNGESLHTGRIVPVYPETEGVTSKWLRGRVAFLLENILHLVMDILPPEIRQQYNLMDIASAAKTIHFPNNLDDAEAARHRLAFEELFLLQLASYVRRRQWQTTKRAHPMHVFDVEEFIKTLPFELTDDQKKAQAEICEDLTHPVPMNRLLVGDVGSGKTVLATVAMYIAHKNGLQSAMMAPTQILAEQHFQTISKLLEPFEINVGLVTGTRMENKEWRIVIGTHALLSERILFDKLGLVVIDEQHRFGVAQRSALLAKADGGNTPHFLTMTATPIPRTVARTIFGDLDVSVLDQMPLGRKTVKTWVVPSQKRDKAYLWIAKQLKEIGGQAFIICPLIEESETLVSVKSVKAEYARLKRIFSEFSLGLLHGRMKRREKTAVLDRFRKVTDPILVSTPVVEVGIDVPNATIMMIEGAERFGLGQLHQLRGRVGRGIKPSYCLLFTEQSDEATIARLKSLETVFSGPRLAEIDLTLRGPGEIFGKAQHGFAGLKIARFTDTDLIAQTTEAVEFLAKADLDLQRYSLLREKVKERTIQQEAAD